MRVRYRACALVFIAGCLLACRHGAAKRYPLVIVLGVDGMDPEFVTRHLADLPNLHALMQRGEFKRLGTTMPPQSPVAWSTFSTGLDPSGHGIFDFVYRDPHTMAPFSAMGETEEPSHSVEIGRYEFPLGSPRVKTFRHGEVFWKLLGDAGVPVKILRMPVNYPPAKTRGESLAGMGVPDMRGTFGTFTFFTDDLNERRGDVSGGQIVPVAMMSDRALLRVEGPVNPYLRDKTRSSVSITVDVDPFANAARFTVQGQTFILGGGEWSGWIPVNFPFAHGMFRVYAKGFRPDFQVYVSPVNFNPLQPDAPISAPMSYSAELARKIGLFSTQGMPEDTAAYRQNILNREEYLVLARSVADEQIRMLKEGLAGFSAGFLFIHFSGVDQNSHMLWGKFDRELLNTYELFDGTVGWVERNHPDARVIVMSDHGFTSFDRAVNLNAWLLKQGYLGTSNGKTDWSKTSAYALGLNAVYLNLAGRERDGTVSRAAAAETLRVLGDRLLALRDPENGKQVVARVWSPHPEFRGDIKYIPDLIVGFSPTYRSSWEGSLGTSSGPVLSDNRDAWRGDHCMAPEYVPGVLISNRKSRVRDPQLKDLTASILSLYDVRAAPGMDGKVIY